MLEFQAEAFFFHFVIALRVELIEECHFLVGHGKRFVKLGENAQFQHLVAEVTPVELHAENGLIEMLQLSHRELLRQQFETDGLKVNLTTQLIGGLTQNQIVIECQRRHLVEWEPLGLGSIVASLYLAETHQSEIGNCDDSFTRVTIHPRECMKLMDIGILQASLFIESSRLAP